jgi:hypothetical protein
MSGVRKSTDAGLTIAEWKSLRASEVQEALSDHDDAEKAFHDNRERLRAARLARESQSVNNRDDFPGDLRAPTPSTDATCVSGTDAAASENELSFHAPRNGGDQNVQVSYRSSKRSPCC